MTKVKKVATLKIESATVKHGVFIKYINVTDLAQFIKDNNIFINKVEATPITDEEAKVNAERFMLFLSHHESLYMSTDAPWDEMREYKLTVLV